MLFRYEIPHVKHTPNSILEFLMTRLLKVNIQFSLQACKLRLLEQCMYPLGKNTWVNGWCGVFIYIANPQFWVCCLRNWLLLVDTIPWTDPPQLGIVAKPWSYNPFVSKCFLLMKNVYLGHTCIRWKMDSIVRVDLSLSFSSSSNLLIKIGAILSTDIMVKRIQKSKLTKWSIVWCW